MEYNAILTITPDSDGPDVDDMIDQVMDALAEFHPSVSPAPGAPGAWAATITLTATSLDQALATARALAAPLGDLTGIEVLPTEIFDRRAGLELDDIELVSVADAAHALGLTTQAVRDRITTGSLPARKVGRAWVVPAAALDHQPTRVPQDVA